jgi:uncharacterized protein (DUF1015 family)
MAFVDAGGRTRVTTGVVGALALSPPGEGDVLPHERTMPKPRGDRLELLRATRANLDPVWMLSMAPGLSDLLAGTEISGAASCIDTDGVEHCLAPLPDDLAARVSELVGSAPVVIADGHHRYETAIAFAQDNPEADRIMALVVELAPEQLCVRPIHRLLIGAGPDLRGRLGEVAVVTPVGPETSDGLRELLARMDDEGALGLVDGDGLALLSLRLDVVGPDLERLPAPLREVDSARLEVALGRLSIPEELEFHADPATVAAEVAKGTADAGVLLRPVSVEQIQAVAGAGERMPEKTTYFSPKPLTGMVFRAVDR